MREIQRKWFWEKIGEIIGNIFLSSNTNNRSSVIFSDILPATWFYYCLLWFDVLNACLSWLKFYWPIYNHCMIAIDKPIFYPQNTFVNILERKCKSWEKLYKSQSTIWLDQKMNVNLHVEKLSLEASKLHVKCCWNWSHAVGLFETNDQESIIWYNFSLKKTKLALNSLIEHELNWPVKFKLV